MSTRTFRQNSNSGGGGITIDLTAEQDLTIGDPVGFSSSLNDSVALGNWKEKLISSNGGNKMVWLGGDRFASLWFDGSGVGRIIVDILEVNRSTMTTTLVTSNSLPTGANENGGSISRLDTDKFIVFYVNDGDNTRRRGVVGTYAAGNITWGSETVLLNAGPRVATAQSVPFFGTDRSLALFTGAPDNPANLIAVSVVGTVITVTDTNSAALAGDPDFYTEGVDKVFVQIDTDRAVIVSAANNMHAAIIQVSAGLITVGAIQILGISGASTTYLASAGNGNFMISRSDSNIIYLSTVGTVMTVENSLANNSANGGLICIDATTFYGYRNAVSQGVSQIGITGVTIDTPFPISTRVASGNLLLLGTYYVIFSGSTYGIQGMSSNFIGFAQATVLRGATVPVLISGVDTNQTGLQPGNMYEVLNGALTITGDPQVDFKVTAQNATDVKI